MIKNINKVTLVLSVMFFLASCKSSKNLYFFNDQTPSVQQLDSLKQFSIQRVNRNDKLNITISSTDPALTAYLNPFSNNNQLSQSNATQQSGNGYLVNEDGNIEFPLLGKLAVTGMTTTEISKLIKEKLSYYYKDLFVNVNLTGRVYFLNGRQGSVILMNNERLTIFEAIAQSGIQDPFDRRNDLWLIREDSGKRFYTQLDLNSKKIFESPNYYLHTNDLLYMKPSRSTYFLSASSPARTIAAILGALSSILLVLRSLNVI